MSQIDIENLLHKVMGLDTESIGSATIERAVSQRMAEIGVKSSEEYWQRLRASSDEVQELIERVVVPETWFFRHHESFGALRRFVLDEWLRSHTQGVLRVLSIPCSTGEEPYSIAMLLLDSGLPAERFTVEAWDISHRALAQARRGVYRRNSFRGDDLSFRERHFHQTDVGYHVSETVAKQVTFRHANLLAPQPQSNAAHYDIVFCRNVLIYFDRPTQEHAITTIKHLLAPKGVTFVGPAEALIMRGAGFVPIGAPMSFGFKPDTAPRVTTAPPSTFAPLKPLVSRPAKPAQSLISKRPVAAVSKVNTVSSTPPKQDNLKEARQLADNGRIAEAAQLCETHLREHGDSAHAHYLLGLIHDASGDAGRAGESYRKAVYLDPNHSEALTHLALLAERSGNASEAQRLHERARRITSRRKA